ncbi:MAG: response regulator [Rhodospirillaceae bacterium]|nr:response regulator [Rhodospirillaceae bacterium]
MADGPACILIVDDDPDLRSMVSRYLSGEGFQVKEAWNPASMRERLAEGPVDLVLLDVMLPGEDGFTLARELRKGSDLGIIMLTGRDDLVDRVVGLEIGADDYVVKPFHPRELLARARTVLRRVRNAGSPVGAAPVRIDPPRRVVRFEGWTLDFTRRRLCDAGGNEVRLTGSEFALLAAFVEHPNQVLDRQRLLDLCRGRDWSVYDRSVDTQVSRLRRKIEPDPARPRLVKSVRGEGYVFTAEVVEVRQP